MPFDHFNSDLFKNWPISFAGRLSRSWNSIFREKDPSHGWLFSRYRTKRGRLNHERSLLKKTTQKKKRKRATGRIHGDVLHLGRAGNCAAYYLKNGYEPADGEEEETKARRRKKGATISHGAFLLRASPLKAARYDFLSDAKTDKPKREQNEGRKGKK